MGRGLSAFFRSQRGGIQIVTGCIVSRQLADAAWIKAKQEQNPGAPEPALSLPKACPEPAEGGSRFGDLGGRNSQPAERMGLMKFRPAKSLSLAVTTTQSLASATAASSMSSALRGRPALAPSDISRAQIRPAFSSKAKTRPANNARGPSGPANHVSSSARRFPAGHSSTPNQTSATTREAMNRSSSACSDIQAISDSDGAGLVMLLMMLVSSRKRVTGRPGGRRSLGEPG